MAANISTHVLNLASGKPGSGIKVKLWFLSSGEWIPVATAETDDDGRVGAFLSATTMVLTPGKYRLEFSLEGYFDNMGLDSFLPEAILSFQVKDASEHFHVPLLLSPNGFSTYRGS